MLPTHMDIRHLPAKRTLQRVDVDCVRDSILLFSGLFDIRRFKHNKTYV